MKKKLDHIDKSYIEGIKTSELAELVGYRLNEAIDLINSHSEAIERLEKVITRDTLRIVTDDIIDELSESADDKPEKVTLHDIVANTPEGSAAVDRALERAAEKQNEMKRKAEEIRDTHRTVQDKARKAVEHAEKATAIMQDYRTVTLRIPKDMKLLDALWLAGKKAGMDTFWDMSDTDLQAEIDKIIKEKK